MKASIVMAGVVLASVAAVEAAGPAEPIRAAGFAGGLVVQVGTDDLGLKELGASFHVRILLDDAASVAKAQAAIDAAGLQGRFTVAAWDGKRLPFADRVVNAIVRVSGSGLQATGEEIARVLVPRGVAVHLQSSALSLQPSTNPVPDTIDDWTHYLYDASGNAVSRDREVAPPVSFRWWAPPRHLRSHNHGSSFTGLVTAGGRVFHFLDEGTYLFDQAQGGIANRWALVARDAFNGAFLWTRPLEGYGQRLFEDVSGQAVPDFVWRTPLSLNRRMVAQGDKVCAALSYRDGPLSILDAATGTVVREVGVGGSVDEIVAEGDLVVCRVRSEIPMPVLDRAGRSALAQEMKTKGATEEEIKSEPNRRIFEGLREQKLERVVAVDAKSGTVLWRHDGPLVSVQTLATAGGKVVFHNYEALVALDAKTGGPAWTYANPIVNRRFTGIRNLTGNLLIADGKVLWTSSATGGGVCLDLADGREIWKNPRMGTTGGFAFPTALRAIGGAIYGDSGNATRLADGQNASLPALGDMLKRGHHIRCFPGKATERYLITPQRGAEFIDLKGGNHSVNDWLRGACSLGNLPANGLFYVTPDPCSCYAGARIYGFTALAPALPAGLDAARPPDDPGRLAKGPAFGALPSPAFRLPPSSEWPMHRQDARRTGRAGGAVSAELKSAWTRDLGGELTQATIAGGRAYVVRKDRGELVCLELADGATTWAKSFPAALDGPPTILQGGAGAFLFVGVRDGSVHCLNAASGVEAWRFEAAPVEALTLDGGRLASLWPVSSSVLFHEGLIYAVAGRNSYLDGGIRLYALDPATGAVRHHRVLEGPRPDAEGLKKGVLSERDIQQAEGDAAKMSALRAGMATQYATGYNLHGAEADLLTTDGTDLYMMQTKLTPALEPRPLERIYYTGLTPMGGMHVMANAGFLDGTMFHRAYWMYDESWPGYGGGSGWAARAGTMVVVGETRAYAAKHYTGGWYPTHEPGAGNRLVADGFEHRNTAGALADKKLNERFKQYGNSAEIVRTGAPAWETTVPLIVRAMLVAPDGNGGERVFSAGIVEGPTAAEWERSTRYEGPGKLLVHDGADGRLLAEHDLPACPAFDGLSAASGRLLIALVNGQIVCLAP